MLKITKNLPQMRARLAHEGFHTIIYLKLQDDDAEARKANYLLLVVIDWIIGQHEAKNHIFVWINLFYSILVVLFVVIVLTEIHHL